MSYKLSLIVESLNSAFDDRMLFSRSITLFIFETGSPESSDAGNWPEFQNILDKPVSSCDGNVITISVFFFKLFCQAIVTDCYI